MQFEFICSKAIESQQFDWRSKRRHHKRAKVHWSLPKFELYYCKKWFNTHHIRPLYIIINHVKISASYRSSRTVECLTIFSFYFFQSASLSVCTRLPSSKNASNKTFFHDTCIESVNICLEKQNRFSSHSLRIRFRECFIYSSTASYRNLTWSFKQILDNSKTIRMLDVIKQQKCCDNIHWNDNGR